MVEFDVSLHAPAVAQVRRGLFVSLQLSAMGSRWSRSGLRRTCEFDKFLEVAVVVVA